jgi:putative membrane protein
MMNGSYGHDWGMSWGMHFFGLFFWVLIIAGFIFLLRSLIENKNHDALSNPIDTLKRRYAEGEIDKETYISMKKDMEL